jgi:hypothetical protein
VYISLANTKARPQLKSINSLGKFMVAMEAWLHPFPAFKKGMPSPVAWEWMSAMV